MGVNSSPNTVTRQRRGCDLNPGPSVPESSTLTTRLPSHQLPHWEVVFITWACLCGQCAKMRDHIAKVRDVLINRDEQTAETIRSATTELQQASLKLFEMAYKKVCDF